MGRLTKLYTFGGQLDSSSEADFKALVQRLQAAPDTRLMIFMHGGLVDESNGEGSATVFGISMRELLRDGWELAAPVWHTGVGETIRQNWDELRRNSLFVRVMLKLIQWAERRFGHKDAGLAGVLAAIDLARPSTPEDLEAVIAALAVAQQPEPAEVRAQLTALGEIERAESAEGLTSLQLTEDSLVQALAEDEEFAAAANDPQNQALLDPEVMEEILAAMKLAPPEDARNVQMLGAGGWVVAYHAARAGWRALKRFIHDRDHGMGPTLIEEVMRLLYLDKVGATLWSAMKSDALEHFSGSGAGTRLMTALQQVAATGKPVRVLLVGHSAGSVFTAKWAAMETSLAPGISTGHILLAPAIRMDGAASLYCSPAARFDGLRIFTMNDRIEARNALDKEPIVSKIYTASLLYLISGVLERDRRKSYADAPLLGLQRHHLGRGTMTAAEISARTAMGHCLAGQRDGIVYAPNSGAAGRATTSELHGGYYQDPATIESIIHIARHGFA